MDPGRLLRADRLELPTLMIVAKHALEWQEQRDRALARLVVNEFSEAMKRGRRGY